MATKKTATAGAGASKKHKATGKKKPGKNPGKNKGAGLPDTPRPGRGK